MDINTSAVTKSGEDLWFDMREEAELAKEQDPTLAGYLDEVISCHTSLEAALAARLSTKLADSSLSVDTLYEVFFNGFKVDHIKKAVEEDIQKIKLTDPACLELIDVFLNYKGFLTCQAQRVEHKLWLDSKKLMALIIKGRVSEVFSVDIHPGAEMGIGVFLDHATGIVVGETAVVGSDVSIFHNVTLGATGKEAGDRHPKLADRVLVGAGTCILGNI